MTALVTRRAVLGTGVAFLSLPISSLAQPASVGTAPSSQGILGAFLRIGSDGSITIVCPVAEIGQGTSTGFCQIVAEELDVPFDRLRFVFSSAAQVYANPAFGIVVTAGSTGLRSRFDQTRRVGAQARAVLLMAAAKRMDVEPSTLTTKDGLVIHPDGRRIGYADLVEEAARLTPPPLESLVLKEHSKWKTIGQAHLRLDTKDKVCSGQVISDSLIGFFDVDLRSKALGDRLPSVVVK